MEALGVKLLKGYLKVSLQDKLLPQFWSHFDANKSNYVILQEVLEAISDLTNSISFNNVTLVRSGLVGYYITYTLHYIYNAMDDYESVLVDLHECLRQVDLREELVESLTKVYESRLLHHGANTSDIITQYISSVRSLKLLDPTGVVLERVCEPVKAYLSFNNLYLLIITGTVTRIMASLIDDSNNDLLE
uniref:EF-hand domain-containing protein n=1 Tax=Amphimedon queenslandica TaxID=400682 RepID=A0A1X7U209_AMPQE